MEITKTQYGYIIIGAGAAGLMLANAIGNESYFQNKTVLLLDKDLKSTNDRTWCFGGDLRIITGCPEKEFLGACMVRILQSD